MKIIFPILILALLACNGDVNSLENESTVYAGALDSSSSTSTVSLDSTSSPQEISPISLETISSEEVDNAFPFATATEGLDVSMDKALYDSKQHIALVYAGNAYIKLNGKIEVLKEHSYKNSGRGFIEVLKNKKYKLTITANRVRDISAQSGFEGWASIQGKIDLAESNGDILHQSSFYAEGVY
jgi:hypothetical protein